MKTIFDKKWYLIDGDRYRSEERQRFKEHGLFVYDMRSWDNGNGCTIEPRVLVNHEGTIITNVDLNLDENFIDDGYKYLEENDFHQADGNSILVQWIQDIKDGVPDTPTLSEFLERRNCYGEKRPNSLGGSDR